MNELSTKNIIGVDFRVCTIPEGPIAVIFAQKNTKNGKSKFYYYHFLVEQSPAEVFKAINNPRAWWSESIDGSTDKLNGAWTYHFGESHRSKIKTIEMIQDKKIIWLVEDNYFSFTKDKSEWVGNKITFEISRQGDKTQLVFTQIGLTPTYECFNACRDAWTGFVQKSLRSLITTGKGQLKWYEPS